MARLSPRSGGSRPAVHRSLRGSPREDAGTRDCRGDPTLRAVAERRYGVFTAAEALRAGYRHPEIRTLCSSGRWTRLRYVVYISTDDLGPAPAGGRGHDLDCLADAWSEGAAVAVDFHGRVTYTEPWRGRSPERVLWAEKRSEDALRGLDIRVVRIADGDLADDWPRMERRLMSVLASASRGRREPGSTAARRLCGALPTPSLWVTGSRGHAVCLGESGRHDRHDAVDLPTVPQSARRPRSAGDHRPDAAESPSGASRGPTAVLG